MPRTLAALLAVALGLPLFAADPPALPTATVTVSTVTVKDGAFNLTQYVSTPVQKQGTRKEKKGDELVDVSFTFTEVVMTPVTITYKLKDVKATGTDGKAIPAADLEKKLRDGGTVVLVAGPFADEFRKVFKDGTVFIDQSAPPQPPK